MSWPICSEPCWPPDTAYCNVVDLMCMPVNILYLLSLIASAGLTELYRTIRRKMD